MTAATAMKPLHETALVPPIDSDEVDFVLDSILAAAGEQKAFYAWALRQWPPLIWRRGISGRVVTAALADLLPSIAREEPFVAHARNLPWLRACAGDSVRALLCCPSYFRGELVGLFTIQDPKPGTIERVATSALPEMLQHLAAVVSSSMRAWQYQKLTLTDALTGLRNYRFLETRLPEWIAAARRMRKDLALIMADLDHFKDYNDRHGHLAGNAVLRSCGQILRSQLRGGDVACRYGGEEFAVILPRTNRCTAAEIADRLRRVVADHVFIVPGSGLSTRILASFGIAVAPHDATEAWALVNAADRALYLAKHLGRDRVQTTPH